MPEKKQRVTVRSEAPDQYPFWNDREPHHSVMKCDEDYCVVLTWEPGGNIEDNCLRWRFITLKGNALNVRPVQLPSNTRPLCVPLKIESSLRVVRHLVDMVNGRISWSIFDPNPPKDFGRLMAKGLFAINFFIGLHAGKEPVLVPIRTKDGYTEKQRDDIAKLLTDPHDPGTKMLIEILNFILNTCKPIKVDEELLSVQDRQLRMVLQFIEEQIGKEITLSVLQAGVEIAYLDRPLTEMDVRYLLKNPVKMYSGLFDQWAKETMKTRGISKSEAEQFLAKHVTFLAKCEGWRGLHIYPIEEISVDVLESKELAPFKIAQDAYYERGSRLENWLGTAAKHEPAAGIETSSTPIVSSEQGNSPVAEKISKALREKRAKAAKANRTVKDEGDRGKIKAAVRRKIKQGYTSNQAHNDVVALCEGKENLLDLKQGPYFLSARSVMRIVANK